MAGASKTPLIKKLGLKPDMSAVLLNPPDGYHAVLGPDAQTVAWTSNETPSPHFVHLFTTSRAELIETLTYLRHHIDGAGMIWVSWPKKSSKRATEVTEDTIREVCLPMGLVDVKVCAVDDTWSGLKLMIRRELR